MYVLITFIMTVGGTCSKDGWQTKNYLSICTVNVHIKIIRFVMTFCDACNIYVYERIFKYAYCKCAH